MCNTKSEPSVNGGFWVVMMRQGFINCNRSTPQVQDADNWGGSACVRAKDTQTISVCSSLPPIFLRTQKGSKKVWSLKKASLLSKIYSGNTAFENSNLTILHVILFRKEGKFVKTIAKEATFLKKKIQKTHAFVDSPTFLKNVLQFSGYKSQSSFVKCVPRFTCIPAYYGSLPVCRHTIDFSVLILRSASLMNLFINYNITGFSTGHAKVILHFMWEEWVAKD